MDTLKGLRIEIDEIFGKDKALVQNIDNMTQQLLIDIVKNTKTGNIVMNVPIDVFIQSNEVTAAQQFEEQLNVAPKQRVQLYTLLGNTQAIMISDIATIVGDYSAARDILNLALEHGLIARGHNNTWKFLDATVKARWKEEAINLAKELKTGSRIQEKKDIRTTMAEAHLDLHGKKIEFNDEEAQSESEGESKSEGEEEVIETKEEPIQTRKFYSPAAEAKLAERKRYDEESKKTQQALLNEGKGTYVSKSMVRRAQVIPMKNPIVEREKKSNQIPVKKVPTVLPLKRTSQVGLKSGVTPRKIK